jgi:hypothetical protein
MPMIQVPIDDASDDQLFAFAENMGLTPGSTERPHVLSALQEAAWIQPFILVSEETILAEDQDERPQIAVHSRMEGGAGADDPKVIVLIQKTTLPGGRDPVPVSVNGRAFVVQRDMNVEMPYRFYLALASAVRAEVHQDELTFERYETNFTNYPLEVLERPTNQQIREWHARVDNELMPA